MTDTAVGVGADLFRRWQQSLGSAVAVQAARQVKDWLGEVRTGQAAATANDDAAGAVLAFAEFCRRHAQEFSADRSGGAAAPERTPAATAAAPSAGDHKVLYWTSRIAALRSDEMASLREALAAARVDSGNPQRANQAGLLRSLLHVFFAADFVADFRLNLAYEAGALLCEITRPAAERNQMMKLAAQLLNQQADFAAVYECRWLPVNSGFDSRTCETPTGTRRQNAIDPLSLYIIRRQSQAAIRKARAQWA